MSRTIWVSKGASEYVGGSVAENTGKDIFASTIELGFSSSDIVAPDDDAYGPPDLDEAGVTPASRSVKLLLNEGSATALGLTLDSTYYLWARITDTPEVAPRLFSQAIRPR